MSTLVRCGSLPEPDPGETTYTTGGVAKLCNVASRTVSKWFDSGRLKGYRIPGSQDRRVPVTNLVAFLEEHGMPVPEFLRRPFVALAYGLPADCLPDGVALAADAFTFGARVATEPVATAVLGDADGVAAMVIAAGTVRRRWPRARLVFVLSADVAPERVAEAGFPDAAVVGRDGAAEAIRQLLAPG